MARISRKVTRKKDRTETVLPEWFAQYVLLADQAQKTGLCVKVESIVRLERGCGYAGVDLFMFLMAYFASGLKCSLKGFSEECRDYGSELAAVMEREKFPGQSSMSRGLSAISLEQAEALGDEALGSCSDAPHLVGHESSVYRDTTGESWHVMHWDPTVRALRHRALPESDELPSPRRRSDKLVQPGHSGRKRGRVQFSRAMLQHSGTGLWMNARQRPGNSKTVEDLKDAVLAVQRFGKQYDIASERCIVCTDGGDGGWPQFEVGRCHAPCFLTRLSTYRVLEEPEVIKRLDEACWRKTEDSGSGPCRYATELGLLSQSELADTRLVVSRFRADDGRKHGAGVVIDGWQYEIFATDAPVEAFPAAEIVTLYYGRCGQENRFAQEDRRLNLDRIFSYEPGGQSFATSVGLWVWNQQIICGADLEAPLVEPPYEPILREPSDAESSTSSAENPTVEQVQPDSETTPCHEKEDSNREESTKLTSEIAGMLDWPVRYRNDSGWSWDNELRKLKCPGDQLLRYADTRIDAQGSEKARFRGSRTSCSKCSIRYQCSSSRSSSFRKEVWIPLRRASDVELGPNAIGSLIIETKRGGRFWFQPPHNRISSSPFTLRHPMLVPSELQRTLVRACRETRVTVMVTKPPPKPPLPAYIAPTPAARQHRRKTWAERLSWNALPDDADVHLEICGPAAVTSLFRDTDMEKLAA